MDTSRFERLESKVDQVKDDVSELKVDFKIHMVNVENKMNDFASHIQGDNKIINHIEPLLKQLPEIYDLVSEYKFQKQLNARKIEKVKSMTAKLGLISLLVGIAVGISKLI